MVGDEWEPKKVLKRSRPSEVRVKQREGPGPRSVAWNTFDQNEGCDAARENERSIE